MGELYEMQEWEDLPSRNTPIQSERLLHIEQGIYDASALANQNSKKIENLGSYENLDNKPKINGVELAKDSSLEDLGVTGYVDEKINELASSVLEGES